ncbi:MAG: GNAT family N-acetyltransferase [Sphaerochaeta sp.]|jgi:RimJ/RimL family protein N-acetyltransferase|nr:GNAT family N-acetyltransferase [Sphaerochaeta sp.]
MIIHGEKIVLRAVEEADNAMLLSLINDPDTEMMLGGSSWPVSESEQLKWFEHQERSRDVLRCIVALKEDGKAIGTIILSEIDQKNATGHIHIKMSKDGGRGKGYGTDAVNTMVQYAFEELRLNCIYANILSYNEASIRLFERCGFKRDGILRQRVFKKGQFYDLFYYSRLISD